MKNPPAFDLPDTARSGDDLVIPRPGTSSGTTVVWV